MTILGKDSDLFLQVRQHGFEIGPLGRIQIVVKHGLQGYRPASGPGDQVTAGLPVVGITGADNIT